MYAVILSTENENYKKEVFIEATHQRAKLRAGGLAKQYPDYCVYVYKWCNKVQVSVPAEVAQFDINDKGEVIPCA